MPPIRVCRIIQLPHFEVRSSGATLPGKYYNHESASAVILNLWRRHLCAPIKHHLPCCRTSTYFLDLVICCPRPPRENRALSTRSGPSGADSQYCWGYFKALPRLYHRSKALPNPRKPDPAFSCWMRGQVTTDWPVLLLHSTTPSSNHRPSPPCNATWSPQNSVSFPLSLPLVVPRIGSQPSLGWNSGS